MLDYKLAPYVKDTPLHWLFDVEIDPSNPDHAMFTTGYGGWETYDLTNVDKNQPTHWQVMSPGIEETVALALYSPSKGAHVVTAVGDYSGFVHRDLDKPPAEGNPTPPFLGNTHDVSGGTLNPNVMVRVGRPRENNAAIGYSLDGGKKWKVRRRSPIPRPRPGTSPSPPTGRPGCGRRSERVPYVTSNKGATWTACAGLPKDTRVVADRVNPKRFYGIALFDGKLFESTDGAVHFTERPLVLPGGLPKRGGSGNDNRSDRGDDRGGQDRIYATPGKQGDLWLAAFDGLYHAPAGKEFVRIPDVEQIHGFGFGKAAPDAKGDGKAAALYLIGTAQGQRGFFRSTDGGATWLRINDDDHQWGLVLHITGDPKQFGRVYVGTHGRGTFYGDPK